MSLLIMGSMGIPETPNTTPNTINYIALEDPLTKWVDTVNGLIDGVESGPNTESLIVVAANATPTVANGNAALSGTITVGELRVTGNVIFDANTVMVWNSYSGGFYMTDSQWVRTAFSRGMWAGEFGTDGGVSAGYGSASAPLGGAIFANNVGIGTFTPSARLHVATGNVHFDVLTTIANTATVYGPFAVNALNGNGYVSIHTGSLSTIPGYVAFYTGDNVRRGYIGWASNSNIEIGSENGWNVRFTQRPLFGTATPLDSANYNTYALPLTGGTISGTLTCGASDYNRPSAIQIANDSNWAFGMSSDNSTQYWMQVRFFGANTANRGFRVVNAAGNTTCILINDQGTSVTGTFSATSTKSFRIPHPLATLAPTTDLIHAAVEAPRADLIYRGRVQLRNGYAAVDMDDEARMTKGTFVRLVRDTQCFVTNNDTWARVRGRIIGSLLTIECEDETDCYSIIDWMVVGERCDDTIRESSATDAMGRLRVEVVREE